MFSFLPSFDEYTVILFSVKKYSKQSLLIGLNGFIDSKNKRTCICNLKTILWRLLDKVYIPVNGCHKYIVNIRIRQLRLDFASASFYQKKWMTLRRPSGGCNNRTMKSSFTHLTAPIEVKTLFKIMCFSVIKDKVALDGRRTHRQRAIGVSSHRTDIGRFKKI